MKKPVVFHNSCCKRRFAPQYRKSDRFPAFAQSPDTILAKMAGRLPVWIRPGRVAARPVIWGLVLIFACLPLIASCRTATLPRTAPEAVAGLLDLSGWDFNTDDTNLAHQIGQEQHTASQNAD